MAYFRRFLGVFFVAAKIAALSLQKKETAKGKRRSLLHGGALGFLFPFNFFILYKYSTFLIENGAK
jgi:hypothetical protein